MPAIDAPHHRRAPSSTLEDTTHPAHGIGSGEIIIGAVVALCLLSAIIPFISCCWEIWTSKLRGRSRVGKDETDLEATAEDWDAETLNVGVRPSCV
ncbi:hypothetical protein CC80DRAFT_553487 [Byssothecium circinans]|uniref:Uncharacterized protein n=1 Tax=Byssothecium circinans TaxID=147558 RepID=A0A6A5TGA6_9PLEO|nr:hypothetical protein CC80DRAFT_553487 [Byssothecium circinans]